MNINFIFLKDKPTPALFPSPCLRHCNELARGAKWKIFIIILVNIQYWSYILYLSIAVSIGPAGTVSCFLIFWLSK